MFVLRSEKGFFLCVFLHKILSTFHVEYLTMLFKTVINHTRKNLIVATIV
jgi:hypothetical protein